MSYHQIKIKSNVRLKLNKKSDLCRATDYSYNPNNIYFSIDVCIVAKDNKGSFYRLIHEKTGFTYYDKYFWNIAPNSKNLKKKSEFIKKNRKWTLVRNQYKNIKNHYLQQNDSDHPSFVCYIEAVNNVYNSIKQR